MAKRRICKKTFVLLLVGAIFFFVCLSFILFGPSVWDTHGDDEQHRDTIVSAAGRHVHTARVRDDKGQKKQPKFDATAISHTLNPHGIVLRRGVDYLSDYNISNVILDPVPRETENSPHYFEYIDPHTADPPFVWLSNMPRVAYIPNFISDEECTELIDTHKSYISRSLVTATHGGNVLDSVRTSAQTWGRGPAASAVVDRVRAYCGWNRSYHSYETLQILKYEKSQKYNSHNDFLDPERYGEQTTNRAITVMLYFNDVEAGGETIFPEASDKPRTFEFTNWNVGLRIRPKKGAAVVFYDMTPEGAYDYASLHGAVPVTKGVKWAGTVWLRVTKLPEKHLYRTYNISHRTK